MSEPIVEPAPLEALNDPTIRTEGHFRRDHFPPPAPREPWALEVDGRSFTLDDLRSFPRHELTVTLECAGHRRSEFRPPAAGVQWDIGAVSQAVWAGTALRSVLDEVGTAGAELVVLEGADHGAFREHAD